MENGVADLFSRERLVCVRGWYERKNVRTIDRYTYERMILK